MAFICTLGTGKEDPRYEVRGKLHFALQAIGYDDTVDLTYSLFASLDVMPGGDWEFSFCLVETDEEGHPSDHWSAADVARFIGRADRRRILGALLEATSNLVATARPDAVYMHAFDEKLPQRALAKYLAIADVFGQHGYGIVAVRHGGRHSWRFERAPAAGTAQ